MTHPWESEPVGGAGGLCYCHDISFVKLFYKPEAFSLTFVKFAYLYSISTDNQSTLIGVYLDQSVQPVLASSTWVANDSHEWFALLDVLFV